MFADHFSMGNFGNLILTKATANGRICAASQPVSCGKASNKYKSRKTHFPEGQEAVQHLPTGLQARVTDAKFVNLTNQYLTAA